MRAILFDLDGTLIDSTADIALAANRTARELGRPERTVAEVRGFIGDGAFKLLERHLDLSDPEDLQDAYHRWRGHYDRGCLTATTFFPGIRELLASLEGVPLAIVSNKPEAFCRRILEGLKHADCFRAIIGGDSFAEKKPHPMPIMGALAALGAAPQDAIMVGDGHQDMRSARAAGLRAIGVTWGHTTEAALRTAGAEQLASTPAALGSLLAP